MSDNDNNVVYLKQQQKIEVVLDPVPVVCEYASKIYKDVVILGEAEDGSIKMMTTQEDVADILFYLESAKFSLLGSGVGEKDDSPEEGA